MRGRTGGKLESYNVEAVRNQQAALRQAGVVPLHVIPPNLDAALLLRRLGESGIVESLIAFNDPVAYPELYLVDHRWDPDHLSTPGAEILSTLFAERFAARLPVILQPALRPGPSPRPRPEASSTRVRALQVAHPRSLHPELRVSRF